MKKSYLILAAAAALFAACSSENEITAEKQNALDQVAEETVNFDVYVGRTTTRAGKEGTITTASLQTGTHKDEGFGVFGYYTDNTDFTQYATPNFMYNQQVKYNDLKSVWEYEPVKYWPNEFGTAASSDDVDKVSFFAYAPWIDVTATSGMPTGDKEKNITQMTKNTATGDPIIKYVVDTDPTSSVDLLWGVVPAADTYQSVNGAAPVTLTPGAPYLDLVKAQAANRVKFNFRHALAKLNVQIDAFVDDITNTIPLDDKTRIYVRSITIGGFAIKGALNLNNTTAYEPLWLEYDGSKELTASVVTYYDGRKDGKEATINGEQKSEKPASLNEVLIEDENTYEGGAFKTGAHAGVTNTPVNLFETAGSADGYIYVIPTSEQMDVTIIYDVETIDSNLPGYLADGTTHGSSIENRIYKENVFGINIEAGKAYQLKLHLGMTSVKFDAEVIDWEDAGSKDIDLPHNTRGIYVTPSVSTVAAAGGNVALAAQLGDGTAVTLNNNTCEGTMQLNDGTAAEAISPTTLTGSDFVVPANATVYKKYYTFKLTGVPYDGANYDSNNITITQAPVALGLATPTITANTNSFDLTSTGEVTDWRAADFIIKVGTTTLAAADFTVAHTDETHATITLTSPAKFPAKTVTITVKAGDAPAETKSVDVAALAGTLNTFATGNKDTDTGAISGTPFAFTQTTTATGDATITYTASQTTGTGAVFTCDPSSGEVSITSASVGNIITVTATPSSDYYTYTPATTSYTITVTTAP